MDREPPVTRFFHPVMKASQLASRPRGFELAGTRYVLFRGPGGAPACLRDACAHRKAPLSAGSVRPDGRLVCPYHGWHYDEHGRGQSPSQPELTKCDVASLRVVERHGFLWVAGTDTPMSAFPAMGWPEYRPAGAFSMLFEAPLHVALDNFSENEHTPWVHTRLGWNEADVETIDFEAHNFDDRTEVRYVARQRPSLAARLLFLRPGDVFHNSWVTRFDPIRSEYTLEWTDKAGRPRPLVTRSVVFMVPETDRTTRFHVFIFLRTRSALLRPLGPVLGRLATLLGWLEVRDDARFIPTVADTPLEMKGMRLGKYDKPLVHNHKLLDSIYWGREPRDTRLKALG